MQVISHRLPYKVGDKFKIICFGDAHLGHKLFSRKLFEKEFIPRYKDEPNTFFVDLGDSCDMIVAQTRDKRFKASQIDERYVGIDNPVDQQIDDYSKLIEPIKNRLLAIIDGNHHLSISDFTGTNPTRRIAYNLWGPDGGKNRLLGYSGFLVLLFSYEGPKQKVRTRKVVFNLTHGIGTSGKTEGGYITSLGKDADSYLADVHCFGHNHALGGWDRIKIGVDSKHQKIISKKEIRLNTGTFLKAFSDDTSTSYAEKARFKPAELGWMELNIRLHRYGEELYYVKRSFL